MKNQDRSARVQKLDVTIKDYGLDNSKPTSSVTIKVISQTTGEQNGELSFKSKDFWLKRRSAD